MHTLRIDLGERSYPIRIGHELLTDAESFPEAHDRSCRIVTDRNVAAHYLEPLRRVLNISLEHCLVLPAGEAQKSLPTLGQVLDWLLETGTQRDSLLIALGGGVTGDLAGFAAAVYQRGIEFIQIPTTLLAQVDSSVGGKTGVNHARGKNMIGAFHQPRAVITDLETLKTLPARELRSGLAEVIKCAMLGDAGFFSWLEEHLPALLALDSGALSKAVEKCCAMKARIVAADEKEAGSRALLNLGHTFGHAIETHTGYGAWLHGEAVAVGLCMAADLSARLHWLSGEEAARCQTLVQRAGLPTRPPKGLGLESFLKLMSQDKKVHAGRLRLVLMKFLGQAVVTADFDRACLQQTVEHFCSSAASA